MHDHDSPSGEGSRSERPPGLRDDRLYRALASTRRRRLLYALLTQPDDESTLDELGATLTGWEATETGTMATPDDYRRTLVALRHADLPMLDDVGLVSYGRDEGTVRTEPLPDPVADLIERSVGTGPSPE